MSLELRDFRGKLTPETACALEAEARATGKQQQEIARSILHEWAVNRVHAASVLHALLHAEGLDGEPAGAPGSGRP